MSGPSLPADVPRSVRVALETLVASFRPLLAAEGVTEQQWRVLRALHGGPTSQAELARICVMHPASLTGVLARMEREGLIERRRAEDDHRRMVVTVSANGAALVARLAPLVRTRYDELTDAVGAETLTALLSAAEAFSARAAASGHVDSDRLPASGTDCA